MDQKEKGIIGYGKCVFLCKVLSLEFSILALELTLCHSLLYSFDVMDVVLDGKDFVYTSPLPCFGMLSKVLEPQLRAVPA